jgi:hypothetical protein
MKTKKANYKKFVLEYRERIRKGLPIDRRALVEMAKRYHTPVPV